MEVANPGIQPDPIQFRVYTLNNLNDGSYIKNPKRIKVFREGANRHAVIIGEYVPADKASTKSVLLHIKNNLPNCEFAYTDDEQYDDLTLTNDYVVTVQRKGHDDFVHEPHYFRLLNRTGFNLNDTLFAHYWHLSSNEGHGRTFIESAGENKFVTVYRRDNAYYVNTYSVTSGNINIHRSYYVADNGMPKLREIDYNPQNYTLMVAHAKDNYSVVTMFGCSNFPNLSFSGAWKPSSAGLTASSQNVLSLSFNSSHQFLATGLSSGKLFIWFTDNCRSSLLEMALTTQFTMGHAQYQPTIDTIQKHQIINYLERASLLFPQQCYVIPKED